MATMKDLRKKCKEMGAFIDAERMNRTFRVYVDSPKGKLWNATNGHSLLGWTYLGEKKWEEEVIDGLLEDMALGFDDCEDPDCETCNE